MGAACASCCVERSLGAKLAPANPGGSPPTGQFRMREGVSLEKSGTLHRVPVARKGQPARPTMARDPTRRRPRYRSAALARLDWNDIYSCPAETPVDLFSACNVRSPSVMASCLERNVTDERATSIAASPLQISHPNGRPGEPRRLVTSRNEDALSMSASTPCIQGLHCTTGMRRERDVNGAGF